MSSAGAYTVLALQETQETEADAIDGSECGEQPAVIDSQPSAAECDEDSGLLAWSRPRTLPWRPLFLISWTFLCIGALVLTYCGRLIALLVGVTSQWQLQQSRPIAYSLLAGVPRMVSISSLPYLQSDRVSAFHVSSANNLHADFNRYLYRDSLRTPVSSALQTSGLVLQIIYEGQEGPACVDSIAFAFTGACDQPGNMGLVVESMDMALAADSFTNGTWQLRSILPFSDISKHDRHPFTEGVEHNEDMAGLPQSRACRYGTGLFLTAPICYAASERLRLSVLWMHADSDSMWYTVHDCIAADTQCPIGVYYNVWGTRYVEDQPSVPSSAAARQEVWRSHSGAEMQPHLERVSALIKRRHHQIVPPQPIASPIMVNDQSYVPGSSSDCSSAPAGSAFHLPLFHNHLSSADLLRSLFERDPESIHPIYADEESAGGKLHQPSNKSTSPLAQLHQGKVISAHVFQPSAIMAGRPRENEVAGSGMWAADSESTRISCAGSGSLTPIFNVTLTNEQRDAGGAVIVGFRLSTPLASLLSSWTGFDLVVFFDGGDSHSHIYPQPDAQMRDWRPDGVTGRAQIDVPISMLFTVGSTTERPLKSTGSPLTRYIVTQGETGQEQRSVGELLAPMPFWRSVHVFLRNRQQSPLSVGVSVYGRCDVHYTESLAGHLYAHYFFAQTTSPVAIPVDMRLTDDDNITRHWAERLTREVEKYGATETAIGLRQAAAASESTLNRSWCGPYDPTFPSYVLLTDDFGHNPFAPRGSFALGTEQARPGLWHLHSIRGLTGRAVQWSLQYTTNPHFLVESDVRVAADDTLWMSSTGLEDVFFGAHGYAHAPEMLDRADFGWVRQGDTRQTDTWYNMRMFRNWQGAGPNFGDSLLWGLEVERLFRAQIQSVLLVYGKPTTATSSWRTEMTDSLAIGCDDQLKAHNYRIVRPNASSAVGMTELDARHGEYAVVDGQMQYLLLPNGDLWRTVNRDLYTESSRGQLFTQRTQLHLTLALNPQHSQCWLIRRTDMCSTVQAARLFIRRTEWQLDVNNATEWAALELSDEETDWLDGGLWYSQLPPCPHVRPSGRILDVRHPLPFAATHGKSRITIALDVLPHGTVPHLRATGVSSATWDVDSAYLSHRMWTNETLADPPALPTQPLRSYNHFRYFVQCSMSPMYDSASS